MPEMVKLTIDGKPAEAEKGTLLIEAARQNGIEIPAFCYYEGLTLQAACRMCLVEVEKTPKLQVGCTLPVGEGMIVHTDSDLVKAARKGTLEFLLTNHPLDCPVCDKGGECELQDMVFRYGAGESRFTERKHHVDEKQWSPVVYFDAPRCILCYRCVRICNEGMGVNALGVSNRGMISEIVPNHSDHLECDECGACIDICPDQRNLSLSDAALGNGTRRHHLHPLLRRLPDHAGRAQRKDHARQQSRPKRDQRRIPVREGPLRLRFCRTCGTSANTDATVGRRL
jgi:NADH-quinone oxidoreductase subunit G